MSQPDRPGRHWCLTRCHTVGRVAALAALAARSETLGAARLRSALICARLVALSASSERQALLSPLSSLLICTARLLAAFFCCHCRWGAPSLSCSSCRCAALSSAIKDFRSCAKVCAGFAQGRPQICALALRQLASSDCRIPVGLRKTGQPSMSTFFVALLSIAYNAIWGFGRSTFTVNGFVRKW